MTLRGDSERQAFLRNQRIKKRNEISKSIYVSKIRSVLKLQMKVLDIGCGTAHVLRELATRNRSARFIGLDISPAMLKIADVNTKDFSNVALLEGDGCDLPFADCVLDIVITRLAEYSSKEAYRVLKEDGCFFEYGLGPEADKEIREFFPERIEKENFFLPKDREKWKQEVCQEIVKTGFAVSDISDYKEDNYYEDVEELMDLIELVPLLRGFDRQKDSRRIKEFAEKYRCKSGIKITWHYYILMARRM